MGIKLSSETKNVGQDFFEFFQGLHWSESVLVRLEQLVVFPLHVLVGWLVAGCGLVCVVCCCPTLEVAALWKPYTVPQYSGGLQYLESGVIWGVERPESSLFFPSIIFIILIIMY